MVKFVKEVVKEYSGYVGFFVGLIGRFFIFLGDFSFDEVERIFYE